jgi:hypothetical protein
MRRVRKIGFLLVVLAAMLFGTAGGCGGEPAGRIAALETAVQHAETALDVAEAQIVSLQGQIAAAQAAGADSRTLARLQAALDQVMIQQPAVEQFLGEAKAALEKAKANPTPAGELELYVSMGLSALGIFGTAWFKRKSVRQAGTLQAIVKGVEESPSEAAEQVKEQIETKMKAAGIYDQANAIVDAIKG